MMFGVVAHNFRVVAVLSLSSLYMIQGYRSGVCVVGHVARSQGSRLGALDRSLWFLVIQFGRSYHTPPSRYRSSKACVHLDSS